MSSTLTARGEDGKQSKKIERNTRKAGFCAILLWDMPVIFWMLARGLIGAQSGLMGFQGDCGGSESVIASRLAPTVDRVHNTNPM
ncbi:DUF2933 domain-containing protein [Pseudomonas serboccidentalis]